MDGKVASTSMGVNSREPRCSPVTFNILCFVFLFCIGMVSVIFYNASVLIPRAYSITTAVLIFAMFMMYKRVGKFSYLTKWYVLAYVVPFSVCIGYIFDSDYIWWTKPLAIQYQQSKFVVEAMLMIGLIGLIAMLLGTWMPELSHQNSRLQPEQPSKYNERVLGFLPFLGFLILATSFCWLQTPSESIFAAGYTNTGGTAAQVNFNSSSTVGYILFALLFIDMQFSTARALIRLKKVLLFSSLALVVIYFQLLRGDRDCFGLIITIICLHLIGRGPMNEQKTKRRLAILLVCIFTVFVAMGGLRTWAKTRGISSTVLLKAVGYGFKHSTWTSVLLTNLSSAKHHSDGHSEFLLGKTYSDYLLSLPPGMLTEVIGYERPLERDNNPAHKYTDVSSGGIHVVLVPYENFGAIGVFFMMFIIGWLLGCLEHKMYIESLRRRYIYAVFFVVSLRWFWYGDMNFIRAVIIAVIAWYMYVILKNSQIIERYNSKGETQTRFSPFNAEQSSSSFPA